MFENKKYVVTIQCELVTRNCSGFFCEHAFSERKDCYEYLKGTSDIRFLTMTCGGCCGRGVLTKLIDLVSCIKKTEKFPKDEIVIHLASCVSFESYHGTKCPHLDYITKLIVEKGGFDLVHGTRLSHIAETRREKGIYKKRKEPLFIKACRKEDNFYTGDPHKLPPNKTEKPK